MFEQVKLKEYKNLSELVVANCIPKEFRSMKTDHDNSETTNLHIRVTVAEKEKILNNAKKAGLRLSRYVRNCCLKDNVIVLTDLSVLIKELNKVGVNLNQISRLCNEQLITCPDISETKEELKKIYKELMKLSKKTQPGR